MEIDQYKGMKLIDYLKEGLFDVESDDVEIPIGMVLWNSPNFPSSISENNTVCANVEKDSIYIKKDLFEIGINEEGYDCIKRLNRVYGIKNFYFNNPAYIKDKNMKEWDFKRINLFNNTRNLFRIYFDVDSKINTIKNLNLDGNDSDIDFYFRSDENNLENINIKNCHNLFIKLNSYPTFIKDSVFECKEFTVQNKLPIFDKSTRLNSKKDSIDVWVTIPIAQRITSGHGFDYVDKNINLSGLNDELKKNYQIYVQGMGSNVHCTLVHKSNPNFKKAKTGIDHGDWKIYKIITTK